METQKNKSPNKKKIIIIGASIGLLAIGGFSYWFFTRPKDSEKNTDDFLKEVTENETTQTSNINPKPKSKPVANSTSNTTSANTFPIKKGSKGEAIKKVQDALIKTYGKSILPKYGSDGQYGKELATALTSKGFPVIIDEATFNKITGTKQAPAPNTTSVPDSGLSPVVKDNIDIAKNLWLNATLKKFDLMLDTLKRIKSVDQYVKVNDLFKTIRLNGVRQTIVNAALSTFSDATSKQFISEVFKQIGLKYHDERWNLSGFRNMRAKRELIY